MNQTDLLFVSKLISFMVMAAAIILLVLGARPFHIVHTDPILVMICYMNAWSVFLVAESGSRNAPRPSVQRV